MIYFQDPYIVLEYNGSWKEQTSVLDDQGSDAHWGDLDFKCESITREQLSSQQLKVTAFDKNTVSDALIGTAEVCMLDACEELEKDAEIEVELMDKKGQAAGTIKLFCSVHKAEKVEDLQLSEGLQVGVVKFMKIVARGLQSGNFISKPAPYFEIEYGAWKGTTSVGEGVDYVWEYPDLMTDVVEAEVLRAQSMVVYMCENKKRVASTTIPNMLLPGSRMDQHTELTLELLNNKNGKPAGKVTLTVMVTKPPEKEVQEELPPLDYTEAVLLITYIKAEGLVNKELMGKQDPFVVLSLGGWVEETEVHPDAGGEVIWDNLDFRADTEADMLLNEPLEVVVWDKNNLTKNTLIGRGEASLKRVAYSMGKEVELLVNLTDSKQKPMGRVIVRADLRQKPKEGPKQLPEGFPKRHSARGPSQRFRPAQHGSSSASRIRTSK